MVTVENSLLKSKGKKEGKLIVNQCVKRLYTLKEAAFYLGRGLFGVRQMVWRGELPIVRNGRKMFIDINDLESYVGKNKTTYLT